VVAGEAEVFIALAWRTARAGDVIYIPADEVHGARNRGDTVCRIFWVFPVDDYDDVEYADDRDPG
jgi:quercetin dioxygenase-like cupin family protein